MIYDDLATRLVAEYRLFLFALAGRYQQVRSPGVEITPRTIADLSYAAHDLGNTFYQLAMREIDDYMQAQSEDRSDALRDTLVVRSKEVKALIRRMVAENVEQTVMMTRTGMGSHTKLLKNTSGAMGMLVQKKAGEIEFKVTDTSGRRWQANKLLAVIVRDYAYQSAIDAQLDDMRSHGIKLAAAIRVNDAGYIVEQVTFAIDGDVAGHPSLDEIRDTIFHPNSTAQVTPYVSA